MTPAARADVGGVLIRGCRGRIQLLQIVPPFKAGSPRECSRFADGGREQSLRANHSQMTSACAEISEMKEILRRRAAHNGFELSGPAKARSDDRAAVAGSAPA